MPLVSLALMPLLLCSGTGRLILLLCIQLLLSEEVHLICDMLHECGRDDEVEVI
jgi:hypothetical protein